MPTRLLLTLSTLLAASCSGGLAPSVQALPDTQENRDAVQQALSRHREKQKPKKSS